MANFCKKSMVLFLLVASFLISSCCSATRLKKFDHPTKDNGNLRYLVVGDWGRKGDYNQSVVALQMGRIGDKLDIDFVVSTGDNFYDNGLTGEDDPKFLQSFTNVYTEKSLQKQWYSGEKIDSRWLCLRSFLINAKLLKYSWWIQFPLLKTTSHTYDWRNVMPQKTYTENALNNALSESTTKWKIVVGPHAIRSVGHHGDTKELVDHLYMNGHDHCLEHISDNESPIQFLTSGAGSKAWRGDVKGLNREGVNFFYDGQGFMSVQLTPTHVETEFYDVFGKVLHKWSRSKQLLHTVI
ncbi:hypothetical protein K7X08_024783 [Anisodus acutangulus]|uniref:Purple acid phosphatase n=1 Tax=Anisodus acutangulus TaxID=402998 RepID=A0A9Q1RFC2_9SOLA|nr:hypothetical protein K7X08_024783 [Anisodus acutangulus]